MFRTKYIIAWLPVFSTTCFPQTPASQMWEEKQSRDCIACHEPRVKRANAYQINQMINDWTPSGNEWTKNEVKQASMDSNPFGSSWKCWRWVFVRHGTLMHARRYHGSNVVVLWQAHALGLQKRTRGAGTRDWPETRAISKISDVFERSFLLKLKQSSHFVARYSVMWTSEEDPGVNNTPVHKKSAETWQSLEVTSPDLGCRRDASLCNSWVKKDV